MLEVKFASHNSIYLVVSSLQMQEDPCRPKYTASFFTWSELKRLRKKLSVQRVCYRCSLLR